MKVLPTLDRLKFLFDYCPTTGLFIRKVSLRGGAKAGDVAGYAGPKGYTYMRIDGITYKAHRVAWKYATGDDPAPYSIDHKNGIVSDNSIGNLRLANDFQNTRNAKIRKDNTTGFKGVSWHKQVEKFTARIMANKKHINLGVFDTAEEAYVAYCEAAKKYHGVFSNTGRQLTITE